VAESPKALLLFDGVCNFCNAAVLFVIDRDPHERFVFAPLQSDLGQRSLRARGLDAAALADGAQGSMVLIEGDAVYMRSTAALRVARGLRWPWPLLYLGMLLPRFLRDAAYSAFAARRYWFGQNDSCRIPTPELRRRFLA
jgi:predicted DCC family thiol-disulfide oxidoreductase YuxK